jgi:hypothetical protein
VDHSELQPEDIALHDTARDLNRTTVPAGIAGDELHGGRAIDFCSSSMRVG